MNNVKQPSFCQIWKCCEFFSACLSCACDFEPALFASLSPVPVFLPVRAVPFVAHGFNTRPCHGANEERAFGKCLAPGCEHGHYWEGRGKREAPVSSHVFLVLCDVNCCAKGDLAKTSWAVHRARIFITQVPFFLPFSLSLSFFFWKDWVCLLVLSVHCSCRMNLGWFLFFTLYTQQTA